MRFVFFKLLFVSTSLFAVPLTLLRFPEPLEVSLYKPFFSGDITVAEHKHYDMFFHFHHITGQDENKAYERSEQYTVLNHWYMHTPFIYGEIDFMIIPFSVRSGPYFETPKKDYFIRSGVFYAIPLQKKYISTFIGFIQENNFISQLWNFQDPVLEYGKIFFTPGIQLQSQSLVLRTFLEMPVYQYYFHKKGEALTVFRDIIQTNVYIQLRY